MSGRPLEPQHRPVDVNASSYLMREPGSWGPNHPSSFRESTGSLERSRLRVPLGRFTRHRLRES